jgi:zinc protease
VHRDHANAFARVLLDVIMKPRLDAADFERLKQNQKAALESTLRNGNDEALQREVLEALIYDRARVVGGELQPPAHPYRATVAGTAQGLAAVTLEDVRAFRAAQLTRDRVVLGVSGGAEVGLVGRFIDDLMTLPQSTAPRAEPYLPRAPEKNIALLVDKPAAGTAISVGFALETLSRSHPDYPAMKLAETWFGEHRNLIGHLFSSMRERRGLNYGDYAYVEHFVQDGWSTNEKLNIPRRTQYFSMWIRPVEHKNRMFALRQTLWELSTFAQNGIPDDEGFERVRAFVQGYYASKEQQPMRKLGYRMDAVLTGQPYDRDGLRERIGKLTRADVNAAIARHLRGQQLSIVVVTEGAEALKADIVKNAPSPMKYAATPPAGVPEEDKLILAHPLGLSAEQIVIKKPTDLFEK